MVKERQWERMKVGLWLCLHYFISYKMRSCEVNMVKYHTVLKWGAWAPQRPMILSCSFSYHFHISELMKIEKEEEETLAPLLCWHTRAHWVTYRSLQSRKTARAKHHTSGHPDLGLSSLQGLIRPKPLRPVREEQTKAEQAPQWMWCKMAWWLWLVLP